MSLVLTRLVAEGLAERSGTTHLRCAGERARGATRKQSSRWRGSAHDHRRDRRSTRATSRTPISTATSRCVQRTDDIGAASILGLPADSPSIATGACLARYQRLRPVDDSRVPTAQLEPEELVRYSRHIGLDEVGEDGQRRLKHASVLIVGAGGLGSPAALYLAAAGVGRLGIVDYDTVDLTQPAASGAARHGRRRICRKTASARARLEAINPLVHVEAIDEELTAVERARHHRRRTTWSSMAPTTSRRGI